MVKQRLRGASVTWICKQTGISRYTFYYHWNNFQREGWRGLSVKSKRPKTIHRTPQETIDEVIRLRRGYGWCPIKIEKYLKRNDKEDIVPVSHNTIYQILVDNGLNNFIEEPRKTWGKRCFVRSEPNDLWQADFKLTDDDKWMLTFLDDYSRFIAGSKIFENAESWSAIYLLQDCIDEYGAPKQILTDQGTQFYTTQEEGRSKFTKFCERHSIQHIVASKRRPTTIGKVERFHGSYDREAWRFPSHEAYIKHWNYERLHQGIGYLIPCELYFKEKV
jgi:transposase InsO family protein